MTDTTTIPRFQIMTRRPALSGKAREFSAGYLKIALVKVDPEILASLEQTEPKMISDRAKGMVKIIECCSLYYGKGVSSEGAVFMKKLKTQMEKLNSENNSRHSQKI